MPLRLWGRKPKNPSLIFDSLGYQRIYSNDSGWTYTLRDGRLVEDPDDSRHLIVEVKPRSNFSDAVLFAAHVACSTMLTTSTSQVSIRSSTGQDIATISREDFDQTRAFDPKSPNASRLRASFNLNDIVVIGEGRWDNDNWHALEAGSLALSIVDRQLDLEEPSID